MATYNAKIFASDVAGVVTGGDSVANANGLSDSGTGCDVTADFMFNTSGFATPHLMVTGDILRLCKLPKGARVVDWYVFIPDIDGATTSTSNLGPETQDPDAFLVASTLGRTGGLATANNAPNGLGANALPVTITADDHFSLTAAAGGASAGTGGIFKGWVRYSMQGRVF